MELSLTSPTTIQSIDLGISTPRLSGAVDVSSFINLTYFQCIQNDIETLFITDAQSKLEYFYVYENRLTVFPTISYHPLLKQFICRSNLIEGIIPSLSTNLNIERFYCHENLLTGQIPDLSLNTNLDFFYCYSNNLNGFIPQFNTNILHFKCFENPEITGEIPDLAPYPLLQLLDCYTCNLTGSIPALNNNVNLYQFKCFDNSLSGQIPDLSLNTNLEFFHCGINNLTGFAGGTFSNTLLSFLSEGNKLSFTAVNDILAAFVAAGSSNGILNLGGGENAVPSIQGFADVDTLRSRGWIVIVNGPYIANNIVSGELSITIETLDETDTTIEWGDGSPDTIVESGVTYEHTYS